MILSIVSQGSKKLDECVEAWQYSIYFHLKKSEFVAVWLINRSHSILCI